MMPAPTSTTMPMRRRRARTRAASTSDADKGGCSASDGAEVALPRKRWRKEGKGMLKVRASK